MIRKNKRVMTFLKQVYKIIDPMEKMEEEYVIMKIVLLKWLIDNDYIQWDLIAMESLRQDFTFCNILYLWSREKLNIIKEQHDPLSLQKWNTLQNKILAPSIFSGKNSTVLGEVYQYITHRSTRKKEGMFYTPFFVIEFMLRDKIKKWQPEDKIIDPACGCGFFISAAYDQLMEYYLRNPGILGKEPKEIHRHILERNLYGIEKDPVATAVTKIVLFLKHTEFMTATINIFCQDSLLGDIKSIKNRDYALVIGNPPYVGHKKLDKSYRKLLKTKYEQVFQDKGDLSYCFFQKGMDLLADGGELCYITSRYFLEALNGAPLREYLLNHSQIKRIVDFYGQRILSGIQVDPLIITLTPKGTPTSDTNQIPVFKMKDMKERIPGIDILRAMAGNHNSPYYDYFTVDQKGLGKEGWRLLHPRAQRIINKIEEKGFYKLEDLCESKQGVITGRDKAFVLDKTIAQEKNLRRDLLKPWIKGRAISPFRIEESKEVLLYTNDMTDITQWPQEQQHLLPHKAYLEKRRECLRGTRKWYDLQWGRDKEFFEGEKIIFPYKASSNRFALDNRGYYYSADIYGLRVREKHQHEISNQALTLLLNTKVYEFYFKGFAKKLGERLYEYYPNTLMQLTIPKWNITEQNFLKTGYTTLMWHLKEGNEIQSKHTINKVEQWFFDYFDFDLEEREYISNSL